MEENCLEVIKSLNERFFDLNEEEFDKDFFSEFQFSLLTDGGECIILFNQVQLWSSVNEEREWIEENQEYEDLAGYVIKMFEEYQKIIRKIEM